MGKQQRQALTLIIKNAIEAIEEPLNKVIALDDDIEAVHQFRVKNPASPIAHRVFQAKA
jgi:hypothetical protein